MLGLSQSFIRVKIVSCDLKLYTIKKLGEQCFLQQLNTNFNEDLPVSHSIYTINTVSDASPLTVTSNYLELKLY
jgi:hypothetical protein